jgi:hypothetical protein
VNIFDRNFLYGLKPLPSGRFPLAARLGRAYLSGISVAVLVEVVHPADGIQDKEPCASAGFD